jgi:hypothetical protein
VRVLSPGNLLHHKEIDENDDRRTALHRYVKSLCDAGERDFSVLQVAALLYLKKLDELNEDGKARLAASEAVGRRSATDYIRNPAMLDDKERHQDGVWSPTTKRNVSISVAVVFALLVLKSLFVGPGPRVVQEDEHYRVEIVRSS